MSPAVEGARECTEQWARRFVAGCAQGRASLAEEFRVFARAHGVPPEADADVRERVQELLLATLMGLQAR
jgi:hypothetical protein